MIAVYEKDFSNRWNLVVYHDEVPTKSVNGQQRERSNTFSVPDDCVDVIGKDRCPNFSKIARLFPMPN